MEMTWTSQFAGETVAAGQFTPGVLKLDGELIYTISQTFTDRRHRINIKHQSTIFELHWTYNKRARQVNDVLEITQTSSAKYSLSPASQPPRHRRLWRKASVCRLQSILVLHHREVVDVGSCGMRLVCFLVWFWFCCCDFLSVFPSILEN